jgi:hypothetical protein
MQFHDIDYIRHADKRSIDKEEVNEPLNGKDKTLLPPEKMMCNKGRS